MTIPKFSPGCFGSAVAFKKDDLVCGNCPFAQECEPEHLKALQALRERYAVAPTQEHLANEAKRRREEKEAREAGWSEQMLALPKKTRQLVDRLDRGNYDIKGKLSRGENPFGAALPFMRLTAHLLLKVKDRHIDRTLLATCFAQKFGWKQSTADAHARMAMQALEHVGAVKTDNGIITLREV